MITAEKILKTDIVKVIVALDIITSKDIQLGAHVSKSYVSRYLKGERNCIEIDIYMIERIFGIKVKDYIINEQ